MQLLSTEAEGVADAIPEERRRGLVNRAGRVGALLGLTDDSVGAPDGAPTAAGGGMGAAGRGGALLGATLLLHARTGWFGAA
jgi:hypothetical protein